LDDAYKDRDNPEVAEEDKTTEVSSVSIALMIGGWEEGKRYWGGNVHKYG
jgi:hypothetical protein